MKILVSAGPTHEYIDPVRFIGNPSSGRMGFLIAGEAHARGHCVTLVSGPVCIEPPEGINLVKIVSACEMRDSIMELFQRSDVLIMSAAVSDWRPKTMSPRKLKNKRKWTLELVPNPDILSEVARIKKPGQVLIGFALETENLVENARNKRRAKGLDLIIADTPGFFVPGSSSSAAFIYKDGFTEKFENISKEEVAKKIMETRWLR